MRNRREIRTVGLDEHAIERHHGGCVADVLRFGIGDVAGERNHEAEIERRPRVLDRPGEAMQYAAQAAGRPVFANQAQQVVPGILAVVGGRL